MDRTDEDRAAHEAGLTYCTCACGWRSSWGSPEVAAAAISLHRITCTAMTRTSTTMTLTEQVNVRTLLAPPCPRCGSTDTYAEAIEVPTSTDLPPYPVIPGVMHCRRCEDQAHEHLEREVRVMRVVAGPGDTGYVTFGDDPMRPAYRLEWNTYLRMGRPTRITVTVEPSATPL